MLTKRIYHWAQLTPEKDCLREADRAISYRLFTDMISSARGFFHRAGFAGPGFAALDVGHIPSCWVLSLALRSLGLTAIPLRSVDMVKRLPAGTKSVFTIQREPGEELRTACAARRVPLVIVPTGPQEPLGLGEGSDHPAGGQILQTSGTTGSHKAVLIAPSFEEEMLKARQRAEGIGADSVVASFHYPPWTSPGYNDPALTWHAGGCVVLCQGPAFHDPLRHEDLTHAMIVPSLLERILAQPEDAFRCNAGLRVAFAGGTIPREQIEEARRRISPNLFNKLAGTEGAIIATTPIRKPEDRRWHQPWSERTVEVVDDAHRPLPIGHVGRLRVKVLHGPHAYFDDAEATKAFFHDGFFYPGDLAAFQSDGRFALQGRITDVINNMGDKIAPAPIEEELAEALQLSGVCLFSMQNDEGDEELHITFEGPPREGLDILAGAMLRRFRMRISAANVHFLPEFPRTDWGKLKRHALRVEVLQRMLADSGMATSAADGSQ